MPGTRDERRIDQIRPEHHRLRLIFDEVQLSLTEAEGSIACRELREALEAHFAQEEALYYPTLWKLQPEFRGKLNSLIAAHGDLLAQLDLVGELLEQGELDRACEGFGELRQRFASHEQAEESLLLSMS